jgi:hypothetical protein
VCGWKDTMNPIVRQKFGCEVREASKSICFAQGNLVVAPELSQLLSRIELSGGGQEERVLLNNLMTPDFFLSLHQLSFVRV